MFMMRVLFFLITVFSVGTCVASDASIPLSLEFVASGDGLSGIGLRVGNGETYQFSAETVSVFQRMACRYGDRISPGAMLYFLAGETWAGSDLEALCVCLTFTLANIVEAFMYYDELSGRTPLHEAVQRQNLRAVQLFTSLMKRVNLASKGGYEIKLRTCLEVKDRGYQNTALHFAAEGNNLEILQELLGAGAEVNVRNKLYETPLLNTRSPFMISALAAAGADLQAKNRAGNTLLHTAARNVNVPMIRALLATGARVNEEDAHHNTALGVLAFDVPIEQRRNTYYAATIAEAQAVLLAAGGVDNDCCNCCCGAGGCCTIS